MILIGVDPGLRTGISVVQVGEELPPGMLGNETADYSIPHSASVEQLIGRLICGSPEHYGINILDREIHLVVERFVPEARKVDTTALEVIGELRQALRDRHPWTAYVAKWHWQQRSEKDSVTGDVLRRLGLWSKGKELRHVNDASRHVVTRLSKMGHRPTLEKGWPQ